MPIDPRDPTNRVPPWDRYLNERRVIRDAIEGTPALRRHASRYLERGLKEQPELWAARVRRAVMYGATGRADDVTVGLVDRHEPALADGVPEWLPDVVKADSGSLARYGSMVVRRIVREGMAFIWSRPGWQLIKLDQVLELVFGPTGPVELRVLVDDKRVWHAVMIGERMARITDYAKTDGDRWVSTSSNLQLPTDHLPLAFASIRPSEQLMPARPPLLDLAFENFRHAQIRFDRDGHLRVASVPVPVIIGQPADQAATTFSVGVGQGFYLQNNADMKIVEVTGAALKISGDELEASLKLMANMAIAIIERHVRGAESAASRRIDDRQASGSTRTIARTAQAVLSDAARLSAAWARGEAATRELPDVLVPFATSQASEPPTVEELRLMSELVELGRLPIEQLWLALERRELIPQGASAGMEVGDLPVMDDAA